MGSWTSPAPTIDDVVAGSTLSSLRSTLPLQFEEPHKRRSAIRRQQRMTMCRCEPPPYYAGHPREAELDQARRCLAKLPWRIICARFDGGYSENAHRSVVYAAEEDVVQYICEEVFREPFGTHRRAYSWMGSPSAGYGRPVSSPAGRRSTQAR